MLNDDKPVYLHVAGCIERFFSINVMAKLLFCCHSPDEHSSLKAECCRFARLKPKRAHAEAFSQSILMLHYCCRLYNTVAHLWKWFVIFLPW